MPALKEIAIDAIRGMPESADLDDILEEIIYHAKIEQGMADIREGRVFPIEEIEAEYALTG
ncbi:MAG: hypothetical protein FJY65_02150 [Calditrichaeota bacterium]|nr:hypothetical protein [Calditrichota bacterium]